MDVLIILSREAGRSGLPKSLGSYRGQCHYRLAPTQLVRGWGTLVSWHFKPSRPLRGRCPPGQGRPASLTLDRPLCHNQTEGRNRWWVLDPTQQGSDGETRFPRHVQHIHFLVLGILWVLQPSRHLQLGG